MEDSPRATTGDGDAPAPHVPHIASAPSGVDGDRATASPVAGAEGPALPAPAPAPAPAPSTPPAPADLAPATAVKDMSEQCEDNDDSVAAKAGRADEDEATGDEPPEGDDDVVIAKPGAEAKAEKPEKEVESVLTWPEDDGAEGKGKEEAVAAKTLGADTSGEIEPAVPPKDGPGAGNDGSGGKRLAPTPAPAPAPDPDPAVCAPACADVGGGGAKESGVHGDRGDDDNNLPDGTSNERVEPMKLVSPKPATGRPAAGSEGSALPAPAPATSSPPAPADLVFATADKDTSEQGEDKDDDLVAAKAGGADGDEAAWDKPPEGEDYAYVAKPRAESKAEQPEKEVDSALTRPDAAGPIGFLLKNDEPNVRADGTDKGEDSPRFNEGDQSNASSEGIAGGPIVGFKVEKDATAIKSGILSITKQDMLQSLIENSKISQGSYLVTKNKVSVNVYYQTIQTFH